MKQIWKDILLSAFMGLVVPVLFLAVALQIGKVGKNGASPDNTTGITTDTASEATTWAAASEEGRLNIPVLYADGQVVESDLEEYLVGVVLAEMPASFEVEALKAQAVVARTYALRRHETGNKHEQGAVCQDPQCCQGYLSPAEYLEQGGTQSNIDRIIQAVMATAGQVLTYEGKLIEATYFSCSGGTTEDAMAVWGTFIPYLQSTDSPGEEEAAHYTDTEIFSPDDFALALGFSAAGDPKSWFGKVTYTNGGGVDTMQICGKFYKGTQLRSLLGLRSTDFSVNITDEGIVIVTHGYGHRVGMSQYGADAMAVTGSTYDEILAHYYQGTTLGQYVTTEN